MKAFFKKIWNTPLSVRLAIAVLLFVFVSATIALPMQVLFVTIILSVIVSIIRLIIYCTDGY